MLLTHRPALPLCQYVEFLWYYDGRPTSYGTEHVLPNGRLQILIDLSRGSGAVCGMRSKYIVVAPAAIPSVIGAVFRPGGARGFFGMPCGDLYNEIVALDAVWGRRVWQLHERLRGSVTTASKFQAVEDTLVDIMRRAGEERLALHESVQHALRGFHNLPHIRTVAEVAKETGLSRRWFSQLFAEQVGMTPKLYCRLLRFRKVVRQVAAGAPFDWTEVALAGGYSDHAHLAHEFRDFSGASPSQYLAAERPHLNHVRVG